MKWPLLPLLCCVIALHHVVVEGLYLLPLNPLTPKFQNYVHTYMEPLFQQHWQLFAPNPALYSLQLWFRCGDSNGASTSWFDPVAPLHAAHQRWRISAKGKVASLYEGIARGYINAYVDELGIGCDDKSLAKPACDQQARWQAAASTYGITARLVAIETCRDYVTNNTLQDLAWVQFQATKVYPKQFSDRLRDLIAGRIEYLQADVTPVLPIHPDIMRKEHL